MGLAILGTILISVFRSHLTTTLVSQGRSKAVAQKMAAVYSQSRGGQSGPIPHYAQVDFAYAIRTVLYGMAIIMIVAAVVALIGRAGPGGPALERGRAGRSDLSPGDERGMPTERRDALVVALAVATGGMDAIGFIAMGGVFASVMTGNLVLLGVSVGHRSGSLAAHVGVALAGYIVGVVAGAIVAGRPDRGRSTWPARVTAALLVEMALIIGVTIGWELVGGHPIGDPQLLLLGMAALAMGIQSSAVRALADPGLSSTYMTATLTNLVSAVAAGRGWAGQRRNVAVIAAVLVGAAAAGVLVVEVPRAAPVVSLAALGSVIVSAHVAAVPAGPRRAPG